MIKAPNCDRGRSRSEKRINRLVTLIEVVPATSPLDHIRLARHRSEQLAKVRQLTPNIHINPQTLAA